MVNLGSRGEESPRVPWFAQVVQIASGEGGERRVGVSGG